MAELDNQCRASSDQEAADTTAPEAEAESFPDKKMKEWVDWALEKKNSGVHYNEQLASNRSFQNPAIFEKMVAFCGLDEYGSNYATEHFDPAGYKPEQFTKSMTDRQRRVIKTIRSVEPSGDSRKRRKREQDKD